MSRKCRLASRFPSSREAAITWIIDNQLGRRNLTPELASFLRGKRYNREKKAEGERGPQKLDQNDPASTAVRIAREYKVGEATIKRDGQYAAALDALAESVGEDFKEKILTRDSTVTKRDVLELARMDKEEQKQGERASRSHTLAAWSLCKVHEQLRRVLVTDRTAPRPVTRDELAHAGLVSRQRGRYSG